MSTNSAKKQNPKTFRILSLDGGGSKGFYTLGILRELEAYLERPLSDYFDSIYGTSTGSIIAALIGVGKPVNEIIQLYQENVVGILGAKGRRAKSASLKNVSEILFQSYTWEDFNCCIGIVSSNWTAGRPLIFKNSSIAAHRMAKTFTPGFGRTIAEAIQSSCAATPFFMPCILELANVGVVESRDGGFSANNPSLFSITDAVGPQKFEIGQLRLFSLGVGHYPTPKLNAIKSTLKRLPTIKMLESILSINSATTEILTEYLFPELKQIRIDERFESPELSTDFLETDQAKLGLLLQKGRESFRRFEEDIEHLVD